MASLAHAGTLVKRLSKAQGHIRDTALFPRIAL